MVEAMHGLYEFPPALRAAAETALTAGETVAWTGRPSPVRAFLGSVGVWLFAFPWTAFSLVFFGSGIAAVTGIAPAEELEGGAGWFLLLFSLPFVMIGALLLSIPVAAARQARLSGFLITDRRVLQVGVDGARSVRALAARALRGVESRIGADGRGVVKALGPVSKDSDGDRTSDDIIMIGIAEAARAEAALWRLIEASGGARVIDLSKR